MNGVFGLLRAAPHGAIAFYNTRRFQQEHGYRKPHELKQALDALKHEGYVVLVGEGLLGSMDRWAHKGNWDHNWMPDMVIVVPRLLFDQTLAEWRARCPGRLARRVDVGFFERHADVQWLNCRPEGGGNRARVVGQFRASLRAARGAR